MAADGQFGRRDFLKTTAALGAAFTIVPRHVLGGPRHVAPSEKLNIAGIGIGGQGASQMKHLETENIVALCDVDPLNYAAKTIAKYPQAKVYTDYRELLAKQKDLDAVVIATPDHTHAVITMAAMKAGKHVYCQKPLTHSVWEARMIAKAAKECGVVTQMGIQGHSGEGAMLLTEWIQGGAIGDVKEVHAWCSDSYYPWGHAGWSNKWGHERPTDAPPVPKGMDWNLWIGPAQMRPYHPAYHPLAWRSRQEFGNGWMGDRGVHTFDPIVTALKLGAPLSVDATSLGTTEETHPVASVVTFRFAAREGMPAVKLTWFEGTRAPRPMELEDSRSLYNEGGVVFKGSKATIICGTYGDSPRIIPEKKMKAMQDSLPPKTIKRIKGGMMGGHEQDWVAAIKEGRKAGADFEYGGALTETCLLGNVAKRMDTILKWDSANMKVTNNAKANELIRTPYREGWSLEG